MANVSPTLLIDGAARVTEGSEYQLTLGLAEDPGDDTATIYRVTWEDGSTPEDFTPEDLGSSRVVTHPYAGGGPRTISVELIDEDDIHLGANESPFVNGIPSLRRTPSM